MRINRYRNRKLCEPVELLYLEAEAICVLWPDLSEGYDPATGMGPKQFRIWSLLQSLFLSNSEEDLTVKAKSELMYFVEWYRRASEFEQSET